MLNSCQKIVSGDDYHENNTPYENPLSSKNKHQSCDCNAQGPWKPIFKPSAKIKPNLHHENPIISDFNINEVPRGIGSQFPPTGASGTPPGNRHMIHLHLIPHLYVPIVNKPVIESEDHKLQNNNFQHQQLHHQQQHYHQQHHQQPQQHHPIQYDQENISPTSSGAIQHSDEIINGPYENIKGEKHIQENHIIENHYDEFGNPYTPTSSEEEEIRQQQQQQIIGEGGGGGSHEEEIDPDDEDDGEITNVDIHTYSSDDQGGSSHTHYTKNGINGISHESFENTSPSVTASDLIEDHGAQSSSYENSNNYYTIPPNANLYHYNIHKEYNQLLSKEPNLLEDTTNNNIKEYDNQFNIINQNNNNKLHQQINNNINNKEIFNDNNKLQQFQNINKEYQQLFNNNNDKYQQTYKNNINEQLEQYKLNNINKENNQLTANNNNNNKEHQTLINNNNIIYPPNFIPKLNNGQYKLPNLNINEYKPKPIILNQYEVHENTEEDIGNNYINKNNLNNTFKLNLNDVNINEINSYENLINNFDKSINTNNKLQKQLNHINKNLNEKNNQINNLKINNNYDNSNLNIKLNNLKNSNNYNKPLINSGINYLASTNNDHITNNKINQYTNTGRNNYQPISKSNNEDNNIKQYFNNKQLNNEINSNNYFHNPELFITPSPITPYVNFNNDISNMFNNNLNINKNPEIKTTTTFSILKSNEIPIPNENFNLNIKENFNDKTKQQFNLNSDYNLKPINNNINNNYKPILSNYKTSKQLNYFSSNNIPNWNPNPHIINSPSGLNQHNNDSPIKIIIKSSNNNLPKPIVKYNHYKYNKIYYTLPVNKFKNNYNDNNNYNRIIIRPTTDNIIKNYYGNNEHIKIQNEHLKIIPKTNNNFNFNKKPLFINQNGEDIKYSSFIKPIYNFQNLKQLQPLFKFDQYNSQNNNNNLFEKINKSPNLFENSQNLFSNNNYNTMSTSASNNNYIKKLIINKRMDTENLEHMKPPFLAQKQTWNNNNEKYINILTPSSLPTLSTSPTTIKSKEINLKPTSYSSSIDTTTMQQIIPDSYAKITLPKSIYHLNIIKTPTSSTTSSTTSSVLSSSTSSTKSLAVAE